MNGLKKFWIVFLSFLPFSAGAVAPLVVGAIAGIGAIAGFSIYRTAVPVNMADALSFFSSCWSCQMFADIMATMSGLVPRVYSAKQCYNTFFCGIAGCLVCMESVFRISWF